MQTALGVVCRACPPFSTHAFRARAKHARGRRERRADTDSLDHRRTEGTLFGRSADMRSKTRQGARTVLSRPQQNEMEVRFSGSPFFFFRLRRYTSAATAHAAVASTAIVVVLVDGMARRWCHAYLVTFVRCASEGFSLTRSCNLTAPNGAIFCVGKTAMDVGKIIIPTTITPSAELHSHGLHPR